MSSFRLDGEVAVVTGAGGKLGPHWVKGLTDAGATVFAIDRDEAGLAAVASSSVITHVADVTSRELLAAAERSCRNALGDPSVVVAGAGIDSPPGATSVPGTVDEVSSEDFARVLEVNLLGTFLTLQAFGGPMAARGHGSIVTIGSLYASISPEPTFYDHFDPPFLKPPAYGASKAGVYHLTRYFARLWGPRGVRVNMLSPGGIAGGQDASFTSKFEARVPLGRLGEPTELAGALVFLASSASSYVSGLNLRVDGGFSA
jgi:NAD(P)-dependent dehydrogenase (short-subunit alcohol dehydrogenase family)